MSSYGRRDYGPPDRRDSYEYSSTYRPERDRRSSPRESNRDRRWTDQLGNQARTISHDDDRSRHQQQNRDRAPSHSSQPKMDSAEQPVQDIKKLLLRWNDLMIEKTKVVFKRDTETKIMCQRKADYDKSIAKSDQHQFPSVKELYIKYENHHKERCRNLDERIAKWDAELRKFADSFAVSLAKSLLSDDLSSRLGDSIKPGPDPELLTRLSLAESKLAEADANNKTLREEQLASKAAQDERLLKIEEQFATIQKNIQAEKSSREAEVSELKDKVNVQETQIATLLDEVNTLRTTRSPTWATSVDALNEMVKVIDDKIANVDFENLDDAIEKATMNLPDLETKFARHLKEFTILKDQTVPTVLRGQDAIMETCGQLVEDAENKIRNQGSRIQALEEKAAAQPVSPLQVTGPDAEGPAALPVSAVLPGQIRTLEARLEETRADLKQRYDAQEVMILTLNSQFSNLSTTDLAHFIIGQLEKLYPYPGKLFTDVQDLTEKVAEIEHFKKVFEDLDHRRGQLVLKSANCLPEKRKVEGPERDVLMSNGG